MTWNGSASVYLSSRKKFDELVSYLSEHLDKEIGQNETFQLCASVGLHIDKTKGIEPRDWVTKVSNIDKDDIIQTLIKLKYHDKNENEQIRLMAKHAEAGLHKILKDIEENGTFHYHEFIE